MKTATLWLTLLAVLPCAVGVACGQFLSPAPVYPASACASPMVADHSVIWGDSLVPRSHGISGFSVVADDTSFTGVEPAPVPQEN